MRLFRKISALLATSFLGLSGLIAAGALSSVPDAGAPGMIASHSSAGPTQGTWLGRRGKPEDITALTAFLASDEANFITGVNYTVDGGRVLGPKNS